MFIKRAWKSPRIIFGLVLLLCLACCSVREPTVRDIEGPPTMKSVVENAPAIAFCELVRSAERYDSLVVRTNAVFYVDRENETLYDPDCDTEDTHAWVDFDPSYIHSDNNLKQTLIELIRPKPNMPERRARVFIVGRLAGPKNGPYGHLNGYQFNFSIIRLEKAEAFPTPAASGLTSAFKTASNP